MEPGCNVRWYSSDLSRRKVEILFFSFLHSVKNYWVFGVWKGSNK